MSATPATHDARRPEDRTREQRRAEAHSEEIVPFETSVLVNSEEGFVLGASRWVSDGEIFVVTDQKLPVGSEVAVTLVLPAREETVRMRGTVEFWHEALDGPDFDRSGMGIALGASER